MKIQLWALGKAHDPLLKEAIDQYIERITHYLPIAWKIFPPAPFSANRTTEQIKKLEAEKILAALKPADILIALDEHGKQWDSPHLAELISRKSVESTPNLIFLIGGAFGIHKDLLAHSQIKWSLSKLTFPHQLVRLILAEQVYRACTIMRNEKYHHV